MRQNLLETYKDQIRVAEAYVAKNFDGKTVSDNTRLTTAVLLDNTNRWITEAINTVATQRSDLGAWRKFCLNLTNIAVPSLIANDLVIVHPMTSYSGSVAYLKYVATTDKGGIVKGDEFNSVFGLGNVGEARRNYTSQIIVEAYDGTAALTPEENGLTYEENGAIKNATYKLVGEATVEGVKKTASIYTETLAATFEVDSVTYTSTKQAYVAKQFQMNYVPAEDIPSIGPKMEHIALVAEPRRIAVKYDQISAFQAKTDYGFSLDKQIDSEIVNMLKEGAGEALTELTFSKTLPVGVSKFEHYNGFLEVFEAARAIIYNRTKKFHPNYMVCAADCLQVLRFVNGWTPVKNAKMNGPYKVGEIDGVSVYVSPELASGEFFLGLNGNDMMSSAGVYAPYMAIVPTQLLGTPDGGLMQGFSTWYAKALLNKSLLVAGKIVA